MSLSTSVYLLEIVAWTGSKVETLYLGTRTITTGPSDTPANTVYRGRIIDPGQYASSMNLRGDQQQSFGGIELNNQDGGLDAWFNYGLDGREFRLKEILHPRAPVSGATLLVKGTVAGIDGSAALKSF